MTGLQEGRVGRTADGRLVVVRNGQVVPMPANEAKQYMQMREASRASGVQEQQVRDRARFVRDTAQEVLDTARQGEAGLIGAGMSLVPGTRAFDVNRDLDTIRSNIGFQELQNMRDASPTGGALGQITEKELAFLQAVQGNLDIGQSLPELRENVTRIRDLYDRMLGPAAPQSFGPPNPRTRALPTSRAQARPAPAPRRQSNDGWGEVRQVR